MIIGQTMLTFRKTVSGSEGSTLSLRRNDAETPERHIWEEGSTHRGVAGKEYDEVWDYAEQLEARVAELEVERNGYEKRAIRFAKGVRETKEEFQRLRDALELFDAEGIKSWAKVIVREWKEGKKDYASMKVAEKILTGLEALENAT
jgi:hypothetical protein